MATMCSTIRPLMLLDDWHDHMSQSKQAAHASQPMEPAPSLAAGITQLAAARERAEDSLVRQT